MNRDFQALWGEFCFTRASPNMFAFKCLLCYLSMGYCERHLDLFLSQPFFHTAIITGNRAHPKQLQQKLWGPWIPFPNLLPSHCSHLTWRKQTSITCESRLEAATQLCTTPLSPHYYPKGRSAALWAKGNKSSSQRPRHTDAVTQGP